MKAMVEVGGKGLEGYLGQRVILLCMNYFYAGKLVAVGDGMAELEDGGIVYETGEWSAKAWKDYQKINRPLYVFTDKIEAFARENA